MTIADLHASIPFHFLDKIRQKRMLNETKLNNRWMADDGSS